MATADVGNGEKKPRAGLATKGSDQITLDAVYQTRPLRLRQPRSGFGSGLCLISALTIAILGNGAETPGASHRTDWFKDAKWGVFMHYMADTVLKGDQLSIEKWNQAVDAFDVNGLAEQLASVGAGYFVLTLGQNSGYYCAPNPVYDRLTGITPSQCAKRDLVGDLSRALKARHIRLMVYLPSGAPDRDQAAMKALEWEPGKFPLWTYQNGKPKGQDDRLEAFQRKWESVIE